MTSMGRSHYYVMFDNGAWTIQCDGENSDPYTDKRGALKDAIALAQLDEKNGRQSRVIAQCEDEMFRAEWDSGVIGSPTLAP